MKYFLKVLLAVFIYINPGFSQESSTQVGGYGELHLNVPEGTGKKEIDFHRFIIYLGHNFNEKWAFFSELEIEHAGKEVELEQAYIEYRLSKLIGFRAGVLLQPLGIINLYHEPPTFHGVERPNFSKSIIPTTWWENGIGIFGHITEGVDYTLQVTAGLRADKFSAKDGLRGGRQKAIESHIENPSLVGNINYTPMPELKLGTGFYFGNTVPANDIRTGKINTKGMVSLGIGHLQYTRNRFQFTAEYAMINLNDALEINKAYNTTTDPIAKSMNGFLVETAYDVLPLICDSNEELWAFARFENYNTQAKVPAGYTANEKYNRNDLTFGFSYKPVYNLVVKTDFQIFANAKDGFNKGTKQFNFGVGYFFF